MSLPTALFRDLELARKDVGVGRSALVQMAIQDFVHHRERAALVARYVESYRRNPEGAAEVEAARHAAAKLLAREPWE